MCVYGTSIFSTDFLFSAARKKYCRKMTKVKMLALTCVFIVVCQIFGWCSAQKPASTKIVKIGVFLDKGDFLSELALKSAVNVINNYGFNGMYFVEPTVHKVHDNDIFKIGQIACEMAERGVVAVFGPDDPAAAEIVRSVAHNLGLLHFQTGWTSTPQRPPLDDDVFSFNLYPSAATLSKALATIVRHTAWKSYTVIYEDEDGLVRLQELLKMRTPRKRRIVTFRKLEKGDDHRSVLKEVRASGASNIILDCQTDRTMGILLQAQEVKLLEEYHSYLLTSLDSHTLDMRRFESIKANITSVRLLNPADSNTHKVVRDWEVADPNQSPLIPPESIRTKSALLYDAINLFITAFSSEDKIQQLNLEKLECSSRRRWRDGKRLANYIMEHGLNEISESEYLQDPITGACKFNHLGERNNFKLQVLHLTNKGKVRSIGNWDSESPDNYKSNISNSENDQLLKQGVRGRTFKVVSRIDPPYFTYKQPSAKGGPKFEGYAVDLMEEIGKILECKFEYIKVPDNKYGRLDEKTQEWDGLIRYLLDRKADLAVCDLTITYERRKAVDFTTPFMSLGISILYAKAVKEPPDLLSFTKPLSLDVWLYTGTAYMLMSMIIFLVARLNPGEWENPHACNPAPEELENIWNIKNCFWLTLGSIMAAGCDILPKGISTRMVTGMWWFFSLIMTACYTANLAAFLTMERMGPTINSAEDLAAQTKIKYGCVRDGATAAFFKDSNVSTFHKMWVQMEAADPTVFVQRNKDGVRRVLTGKRKYAFLMESTAIEYERVQNCELVQVGGMLDIKGYGIAMPTNADYRRNFNVAILKLQESGMLKALKDRWWIEKNQKGSCTIEEKSDETKPLDLGHVGGVFVVLAGGVFVALTIAAIEFLWSVEKIAVAHHMTRKEALRKELDFAKAIWERKKAVLQASRSCKMDNGKNDTK